ncbi:MAG TPA: PP2C family serine/threonine-protein phosphatase [Acidimicrobiales bacterium]|nr:PP2C family serine/threonine-protein phosphatase [Acidimicrobiales bacterium]
MVLVGWHRRKQYPVRAPLLGSELRPFIEAGYATDAGPRSTNQDRGAVSTDWAAISDGAGGHAGGEIAAELAIEHVVSRLGQSGRDIDEALVLEALAGANSAVRARRRTDHRLADAAATLTIAACTSSQPATSRWFVANLGDSPVWHSSGENLDRLSEEHNVAAELVRAGVLSPEGARDHPGRHMITRALGMAEGVAPHVSHAVLRPGELLVLASDGVEVLTEAEILDLIAKPFDAPATAHCLVDSALFARATDNVTVAVLRHRVPAPTERGPGPTPWEGQVRQ